MHWGIGADGILELSRADEAGLRRRPAHLQPRRQRGRAVGQRCARGDPAPAPRGLDRAARVLDRARRPARSARRSSPSASAAWTWAARSVGETGESRGRVALPARADRQPADGDPASASPAEVDAPGPCQPSARRSSTTRASRTARTSRSTPCSPTTGSARASSSAVWGRPPPAGTGACGAAIAHVLRGGDSPVTVVLDGGELRRRRRREPPRRPHRLGRAGLRRHLQLPSSTPSCRPLTQDPGLVGARRATGPKSEDPGPASLAGDPSPAGPEAAPPAATSWPSAGSSSGSWWPRARLPAASVLVVCPFAAILRPRGEAAERPRRA